MKLKIGSRESKLAVIQSNIVIDYINKNLPYITTELITMKTTGDKILNKALDKIGGKGLFVKELDTALKNGIVDITIHSYKDMPMVIDDKLPIIAVSKREDCRDVLILPKNVKKLDLSKPIGCSSARRTIQLQSIYPGCTIKPLRGNVITRLEKLEEGEYGAVVLAYAGIKRLGYEHRINKIFSIEEILPSACQGVICVQAHIDFDKYILADFNDSDAWDMSVAERSFVATLDGGCSSPIAALAEIDDDMLKLTGLYVDDVGISHKQTIIGTRNQAEAIGRDLAYRMLAHSILPYGQGNI